MTKQEVFEQIGMAVRCYFRGHAAHLTAKGWHWTDDGTPVVENPRPCARCGRWPTKEGHDACIGHIDGVSGACCGHGAEPPYTIWLPDRGPGVCPTDNYGGTPT